MNQTIHLPLRVHFILPKTDSIIPNRLLYCRRPTTSTGQEKLTLEFLWLILQHVLPKRLQRVRDYGFLRGNAKVLRSEIILLLMRIPNWIAPMQTTIKRRANAFVHVANMICRVLMYHERCECGQR